jgi:hypothetical protein
MVKNIMEFEEDVDYADFLNNFDNEINVVYAESFGSTKSLESLRVPDEVTEICFVVINSDYVGDGPSDENLIIYLAEKFSVQGVEENVFFVKDSIEGRIFSKLSIEQDFCVSDFEDVILEKQVSDVKIS